MKSILKAESPKSCEQIANGEKTMLLSKIRPKLETPFKVYIYETKGRYVKFVQGAHTKYGYGRGKVIGEFVCDEVVTDTAGQFADRFRKEGKLTLDEQRKYGGNKPLYGWHISELKIYDQPKELSEFKKAGFMTEEQWLYALYPNTHCHYAAWAKKFEITRPPQSWAYVEELEE